jgi:hypothetical protein
MLLHADARVLPRVGYRKEGDCQPGRLLMGTATGAEIRADPSKGNGMLTYDTTKPVLICVIVEDGETWDKAVVKDLQQREIALVDGINRTSAATTREIKLSFTVELMTREQAYDRSLDANMVSASNQVCSPTTRTTHCMQHLDSLSSPVLELRKLTQSLHCLSAGEFSCGYCPNCF